MPLLLLLGQAAGENTLGGTSQLGGYSSTGGVTIERVLGGTSQVAAYDSSGGITLERSLGGTSQLEAYASTGGITIGDATETVTRGGYAPPEYKRYPLKKKDEAILKQVHEIVARLEEEPEAPPQLEKRAEKAKIRVKKAIALVGKDRTKEINQAKAQVNRLEKAVNQYIEMKHDEESAIKALLEVI